MGSTVHSALPDLFFCAHQILHDLRDDLVLAPQLTFERLELTLGLSKNSGGGPPAFKRGGSLFEKGFLPLAEERRVNALRFTDLGDRLFFHPMQAQDALLVFGAVLAAGSFFLVHPTGRCVPRSLSLPPDQAISSEAA